MNWKQKLMDNTINVGDLIYIEYGKDRYKKYGIIYEFEKDGDDKKYWAHFCSTENEAIKKKSSFGTYIIHHKNGEFEKGMSVKIIKRGIHNDNT